MEPIRRSDSYV